MIDWLIYLTYNFPCLVNKKYKSKLLQTDQQKTKFKVLNSKPVYERPNQAFRISTTNV